MKKILITGSTGMLGQDLVRHFVAARKHDVYGVGRRRIADLPASKQFIVDLRDASQYKLPLIPDVIIHTAAVTDLQLCERDHELAQKVNVEGSRVVAGWSGDQTALYYISTDSVFDGEKGFYSENDTPRPLNVYSRTKLSGEVAAKEANGGSTCVVRTNIYGLHLPMKNSLAEWAYQQWLNGQTITGFTDTIFNAVFTGQLATILQTLIDRNVALPTLNVGSDEAISKFEFLNRLKNHLPIQNDMPLKRGLSTDFPNTLKRPLNTSLNTNLLSTLCPVPDFENGLRAWAALATGK